MAVPKQKNSKGRTRRRRANKKLTAKKFVKCSHCGNLKLAHLVCPICGFYKEREVIDMVKKLEKKKGRVKNKK